MRSSDQPRHGRPDSFWLRDESLAESEKLPDPGVLSAVVVEDLEAPFHPVRDKQAD